MFVVNYSDDGPEWFELKKLKEKENCVLYEMVEPITTNPTPFDCDITPFGKYTFYFKDNPNEKFILYDWDDWDCTYCRLEDWTNPKSKEFKKSVKYMEQNAMILD